MKSAFVKIDKKERDTVQRVCADAEILVRFYTIEENENLLLTELTVHDYGQLFIIGRMVQITLEMHA